MVPRRVNVFTDPSLDASLLFELVELLPEPLVSVVDTSEGIIPSTKEDPHLEEMEDETVDSMAEEVLATILSASVEMACPQSVQYTPAGTLSRKVAALFPLTRPSSEDMLILVPVAVCAFVRISVTQ